MRDGVGRGAGLRNSTTAAVVESWRWFLRHEAASGVLLLAAAVTALLWANSPLSPSYQALWTYEMSVGGGPFALSDDLRHWINGALMVLFFFVVGLEIKRELVEGGLRGFRTAMVPVVAAVGGVALPAALFLSIAGTDGSSGWGIPMATDIAFAVGVLAVLGKRVSAGARLFLLSLAVVDDVIAIVVIAFAYTTAVHVGWLGAAVAMVVPVLLLRRLGVRAVWPYALIGAAMWFTAHHSGVHATIVGVVLALLTPVGQFRGRDVANRLQRRLHPVAAFAVVPIFALANAGVDLRGGTLPGATTSRLSWAVSVGLLAGKVLGITLVTFVLLRAGLGALPAGMPTCQVWGVAALAGIGFTVSLFIADLAYSSANLIDQAKIGIFAGSLASGIVGTALLLTIGGRRPG